MAIGGFYVGRRWPVCLELRIVCEVIVSITVLYDVGDIYF